MVHDHCGLDEVEGDLVHEDEASDDLVAEVLDEVDLLDHDNKW